MPVIKRRKSFVFVDPEPDNRTICQNCYEDSIESHLVEYEPDPSHYKVCPHCGSIVNKNIIRYKSEVAPLGYKSGVGQTKYEVVSAKRRVRQRDRDADVFRVEDYKLAGTIDTDLVHFVSIGIVTRIEDEGNIE